MSGISAEWLILLAFVLFFAIAIIAEVLWLVRKGWASSGTASAYVLITDLLGFGIGSIVVLTIFFIAFMMVMGPAGTGGNAPQWAYAVCLIFAIIIPTALLIGVKRLFLLFLKIGSGSAAWIYSVAASLIAIALVFMPPTLLFFLFMYLSKWK